MTDAAVQFYDSLPESVSNVDKELVKYFVYYLTQNLGNDAVTAKQVDSVFSECDLSPPRRTAAYLSEGSKAKPRVYVKVAGGYRLERNAKRQLEETLFIPRETIVPDKILPADWFADTRKYLEALVHQINGGYEFGFYDSSAVMMRRLMETLLIEVFVSRNRANEIKAGSNFLALDEIIKRAFAEADFHWNRNSKRDAEAIKRLGDVAAHDRAYITHKNDIDDLAQRYRRLVDELIKLSGVKK